MQYNKIRQLKSALSSLSYGQWAACSAARLSIAFLHAFFAKQIWQTAGFFEASLKYFKVSYLSQSFVNIAQNTIVELRISFL